MEKKLWYTSKTLWVNLLAVVSGILLDAKGINISPTVQLTILAGINALLRFITKKEIVWEK